jgi:hypothetical protein
MKNIYQEDFSQRENQQIQNRGPIYRFLADDHARLDALLQHAFARGDRIDLEAYAQFRAGLLKHIAMEEKTLLSAAQKVRGGEPLSIAAKLRLHHAALAALLVPLPTRGIAAAIRAILGDHNPLEEGPGGVYEVCEELAGSETDLLLIQLQTTAEIKVAPHNDGALVMKAAHRALTRAGYSLEDYT